MVGLSFALCLSRSDTLVSRKLFSLLEHSEPTHPSAAGGRWYLVEGGLTTHTTRPREHGGVTRVCWRFSAHTHTLVVHRPRLLARTHAADFSALQPALERRTQELRARAHRVVPTLAWPGREVSELVSPADPVLSVRGLSGPTQLYPSLGTRRPTHCQHARPHAQSLRQVACLD